MLKGLRFQTKLFFLYSFVVTFIIVTALFSFYLYNSKLIEARSNNNLNQLTSKSSEQIENILLEMDRIALYITTNPSIKKVYSTIVKPSDNLNFYIKGTEENQVVMDNLMSIFVPKPASGLRISIYNKYGNYISIGFPDYPPAVNKRLASPEYASWYEDIMNESNAFRLLTPHDDFWSYDSKVQIISLFREIKNIDTGYSYGAVEIQQSYSVLEKVLKQTDLSNYLTYVADEKENLVYSSSAAGEQLVSFFIKKAANNDVGNIRIVNPITGKAETLAFQKSSFSGWTVFMVEPDSSRMEPVYLLTKQLLGIGFGLWLITLITVFIITNHLIKPLKLLRNSVKAVNLNNLSINIAQSGNNEIIQLNDAFNGMFKRLEDSMSELIQTRSHEMKAHMIALQSQMDPHFLYNMLSVISASSREAGNPEITEICLMLSDMLRYTTSYNDDLVPIKDEIEHVSNYLKLMKFRFEDRFNYTIDVDDKVLDNFIDIPKLTLQPLAENCFQHGFKKVPSPWMLTISISIKENRWIAEVSDNGAGFEEDKIKDLLNRVDQFIQSPSVNIKDLKLGGMGLINTLVRLKLIYKDDMLFRVEKNENNGSKITIGGLME